MKRLNTTCSLLAQPYFSITTYPYLNRADICVLCGVLVLVEAIFGEFAFAEIHTQLDKQDHHRLERGDGAVTCTLGDDMFMEKLQRGLRLLHSDQFLCAFAAGR